MKRALLVLLVAVIATRLHAADPMEKVKEMPIVKNLVGGQAELLEARELGTLYEIIASFPSRGKQIFYVTTDGSYLLSGNLFNQEKVNLTKERYDEINKVDLAKLPLQDAIPIRKGSGAKKLVMFTDVDCQFCRKAYEWLKTQTDYTLYVFMLPLPMHPKAPEKSIEVLCSKDREVALDLAQSDQEITAERCEEGEKTLREHKAIAEQLNVTGTPLFITENGTRISGFDQSAIAGYLQR